MVARRRTSPTRFSRARPFSRVAGNRRFRGKGQTWCEKHNHTPCVGATASARTQAMTVGALGRAALGAAVHWSGAGRAFEIAARPGGAIILMYHSVAPDEAAPYIEPANRIHPRLFERQMAFLAAERRT